MVQKEIQLAFSVKENEDRNSWQSHSPLSVSTSANGHQVSVKENNHEYLKLNTTWFFETGLIPKSDPFFRCFNYSSCRYCMRWKMPISNFPLCILAPATAVDLQELTVNIPLHPQTLHGHNLYPSSTPLVSFLYHLWWGPAPGTERKWSRSEAHN